MRCKHKKRLTVYGRDEKNWINVKKIRGKTVYICEECGEIFQNSTKAVEVKKHE